MLNKKDSHLKNIDSSQLDRDSSIVNYDSNIEKMVHNRTSFLLPDKNYESVSMIVEPENETGNEKNVSKKKIIVKYNNKSLDPFEGFVEAKQEIEKLLKTFILRVYQRWYLN